MKISRRKPSLLLAGNTALFRCDFAFPTTRRDAGAQQLAAGASACRGVVVVLFTIGKADLLAIGTRDGQRWCCRESADGNQNKQDRADNKSHDAFVSFLPDFDSIIEPGTVRSQ
jgi:hypothetical protein